MQFPLIIDKNSFNFPTENFNKNNLKGGKNVIDSSDLQWGHSLDPILDTAKLFLQLLEEVFQQAYFNLINLFSEFLLLNWLFFLIFSWMKIHRWTFQNQDKNIYKSRSLG